MADDGMILNFDMGSGPVKPHVKIQGGRWRDRNKAQRIANRSEKGPSPPSEDAPPPQRYTPGSRKPQRDDRPGDDDGSYERPAKRPRAEHPQANAYRTGKLPPGSISSGRPRDGPVTSKLFSYNPTPKTIFDEPGSEKVEEKVAEPSNAPLSDEAASFHALGISRRLALTLSGKIQLKAPTAIQAKVIPQLITEDSDAFVQAQTGSGKTLAYLLPIIQRILSVEGQIKRDSGLFAIVMAPTRELCRQIELVLAKVLPPYLVSTTVIGGESKHSEKSRLRKGVNILIATPGRLSDHLQHTKTLDVGTVRWLVLDEGDRLMEMGFEAELRTIVSKIRENPLAKSTANGVSLANLPQRRVTVLCSATMRMNVQKLGEISLEDAVHISTSEEEQVDGEEIKFEAPAQLKQNYLIVPAKLRLVTLIALLKSTFSRKGSVMKAIVFLSCADSVDYHFDLLRQPPGKDEKATENPSQTANTVAPSAYITSAANTNIVLHKLHGSLPQPVRTATLASYSKCTDPTVLITTDIASRGLDVPSVELVVEYDPAFSAADHVHRIGRTARAGRPGKAVLFLMPGCEEGYIDLLKAQNASPPKPELYDTVLHKGLTTGMDFPVETDAKPQPATDRGFSTRAENLQLHLEQRLLLPSATKLLDEARKAFRSHIRAYATHIKEERVYFDINELHLGHMAKAYGLREAPSGIGRGGHDSKKTTMKKKAAGRRGDSRPSGNAMEDIDPNGAQPSEMERKMKQKMKSVMNAASEFNLG
ncbi:DEAD/DEAH box helicase [Colletotrichum navitas]|uniref:ATP-dependent RNA helicase n=1 Tax=Colletotrichum navitas TaxID=681940 RepID=A0AAD8QC27_9PEZI|nr:DEAD/DEAH box helicase [Colletotrichum navitas]KAK1598184.1 DEAD/DEAH box helicase [Colletotrichum navitas]